jgi:hypothetical protein
VHGLRQTYHRLRKSFRTHPTELFGAVSHVESRFDPFGVLVSMQDSMVCAKLTVGSKIILDAPDGTPR